MATSGFDHIGEVLKSILSEKELREALKAGTSKEVSRLHDEIVEMLRTHNYPTRGGGDGTRVDPIRGTTPTERLHPGTPPLHIGMQKPKYYHIKDGVRIIMTNISDHAALFFEESPAHAIPQGGDANPPLYFWWGAPLPWDRLDTFKDGPRKMLSVSHPGHMAYIEIIDELYHSQHEKPLADAVSSTIGTILKEKLHNA